MLEVPSSIFFPKKLYIYIAKKSQINFNYQNEIQKIK
jgi:hypothetical protein